MFLPGGRTAALRRVRPLGEGGAGLVWLAEDPAQPEVRVALKELRDADSGKLPQLAREFAVLSQMSHPNLVRVEDFEPQPRDGPPFFTMELIEGVDIVSAVRRDGPESLLPLAAEALRALAFLHDFRIIHRDLKPANLLVRNRPVLGCRLVVLDFGLAMRGHDDEPRPSTSGTLPYIAPEIFEGASASPRSDLYGLGAVLFEAIHSHPPFVPMQGDLNAFLIAVRAGKRQRASAPPGFPAGLEGWVETLLTPDPADRPASASEALAGLNAATGSQFAAETHTSRAARLASGPPPGREREIDELWELLTISDRARIVWLTGPAGTGRTRMMRWLRGDAVARGWDVVPMTGASHSDGGAEGTPPMKAADALASLRKRAAQRPTLVLLDQVASGGRQIFDFLESVARERGAPPVRVVVRLDEDEARHPSLRTLVEQAGAVPTLRRLDLPLMDLDGIRALAARAAGERGVSDARVRWLLSASQGNPLVAETLLTEMVWERGGRPARPVALEGSTALRLEPISPAGVAWLRALAILGDDASEDLVTTVAGLAPDAARDAAVETRAASLMARGHSGWSPASRTQAAEVLALTPDGVRREMFRRAAERVEGAAGAEARHRLRLARLWSGADDRERAVVCALEAARIAADESDAMFAADALALALANLPRRDPRRLDLRIRHGGALREANVVAPAVRAYGAAARLARDPAARADLKARQAEMLVQAGRLELAQELGSRALQSGRELGRADIAARALEAIGIAWARRGRAEEAVVHLGEALSGFARIGDLREQAHATQALAIAEANGGIPEAGVHFREALSLYERLGEPRRGLMARVGLGVLEQRAGRYAESNRIFEESRRLAAEHRNIPIEAFTQYYLARNALHLDWLGTAVSRAEEAEDAAQHLADERLACIGRTIRAVALARGGRAVEASTLMDATLERPLGTVDSYLVGELRLAWVEAKLNGPAPDEARLREVLGECLAQSREWKDPDNLLWCLALELERRARPPFDEPLEPIRLELEALVARGGQWAQPFYAVRAEIAEARGLLASGRFEAALGRAETASERARSGGLVAREALATALVAEALDRLERPDEANDAIRRARDLLDRAAAAIDDPDLKRGFLDLPEFARIRRAQPAVPQGSEKRLLALYEMTRALNAERDSEALLETILDMAVEVVGARRGMILLVDPRSREFNVTLARDLEKETIADVRSFSRKIVEEAGAGKPILALDAPNDARFQDLKSVTLFHIRSLMCVPLRSRGQIVGTVYVDDRGDGRLFTPEDLRFLEAFADHAGLALENVHERERLVEENQRLQLAAEERVRFGNMVGRCPAMQQVFRLIEKVAPTSLPVLVHGETGTGKELVARAIHFHSLRRKAPFISENCAALPENLLQSELFGHVRGAFTGADRQRRGLFELASGGTLFLDEIGDMSAAMQAQLLRVLQEGEVRRVGDDRPIKVDVRPILATHRDLEREVAAGRFREDLMYRMQVLTIELPPLRERLGDLPLLVDDFLEQIAQKRDLPKPRISQRVVARFEEYDWPGNIRQLQNAIYRAAVLAGDHPITVDVLAADPGLARILEPRSEAAGTAASTPAPELPERERIRQALLRAGNNRTRAARILGLSRATIYRKIEAYEL